MVVEARDLPSARLRRWGILLGGALIAVASLIWAVHSGSDARRRARELQEREYALTEHQARADDLARQCGIPPFRDEESLEHFPITLGRYPTKEERACSRDVGNARADLIDDYLKLHDMRPALVEARAGAKRSLIIALVLAAAWVFGLWLAEIRPRRGRAAR